MLVDIITKEVFIKRKRLGGLMKTRAFIGLKAVFCRLCIAFILK